MEDGTKYVIILGHLINYGIEDIFWPFLMKSAKGEGGKITDSFKKRESLHPVNWSGPFVLASSACKR